MTNEQLCLEVAVKVMGWAGGFYTLQLTGNDALLVVKRMLELGFLVTLYHVGTSWRCRFGSDGYYHSTVDADTMPEAVFKAALKTVEATNG